MGFVFPHSMQSMLEENFTDKIIHTYRDDPDLQNLIDFAQQEVSFSSKISGRCLETVFLTVSLLRIDIGRLHGLGKKRIL